MKLRGMLMNTALLTASGLVMRCIGIIWQIWLVGRIGAAGIGLYQLVMSVGSLAATVAISGIRFSTTRIVSEEYGKERPGGVGFALRRCTAYAAVSGALAAAALYVYAEKIGFLWIGDARTVLSLKILALSMPAVSLGAMLSGYFTAVGRVWKSSLVALVEQLCRIVFIVVLLRAVPDGDLSRSCAAVTEGGVAADFLSLALLLLVFVDDRRREKVPRSELKGFLPRLLKVAVPLAFSAYARVALNTAQQILIPRGLRGAGYSADSSLAGYGIIQGMVFPIVTFPSCILTALSEMLVPFMTRAQMEGDVEYIRKSVSSMLFKCLVYSLTVAAVLFIASDFLAMAIYKTPEAARYIRLFAIIVPVMYMDIVADGCLKGLGEMMRSMSYNVMDSAIGVILIATLVPKFALGGYVAVVFITEGFNFWLSLRRLKKCAGIRMFDFKNAVRAACFL